MFYAYLRIWKGKTFEKSNLIFVLTLHFFYTFQDFLQILYHNIISFFLTHRISYHNKYGIIYIGIILTALDSWDVRLMPRTEKFSKIKSTYNIVHNFVTVRDKKNTKHKIWYFLNKHQTNFKAAVVKGTVDIRRIFGTNFSVWGRRGQDSW